MPLEREDDGIARLGTARKGDKAFLSAHHLAAALRFERLIERAQMRPRVTMSYNPASVGGQGNGVENASDGAAEARQKLNRLATGMPADCWSMLVDCCVFGKGMQAIETERRWPRRSAKLVLRIALDHLASRFGLSPEARGVERGAARHWLDERLPLIVEKSS